MIMNKMNIQVYFPEMKLVNRQGNLYVDNYTYEEVKKMLEPFRVPIPSELITSKYKEKVYKNKEAYRLNDRYYLLKRSKNGYCYLFNL